MGVCNAALWINKNAWQQKMLLKLIILASFKFFFRKFLLPNIVFIASVCICFQLRIETFSQSYAYAKVQLQM